MNGLHLGGTRGRGGREREETTHSLFGGEQQKRTFPFIDHQSRGGDRTVNLADHRLYNPQPCHAMPVPDSDPRMNYRARYRYHHDNRETAIKPYPLNCAAKKTKKTAIPCKKVADLRLPPAEISNVNPSSSFLPIFSLLCALIYHLGSGSSRDAPHNSRRIQELCHSLTPQKELHN